MAFNKIVPEKLDLVSGADNVCRARRVKRSFIIAYKLTIELS